MLVGQVTINWFGQDAFRLQTRDLCIYIDPYKIQKASIKGQAVLITHDHFDHCEPSSVKAVAAPDAAIVAPSAAASKLGNATRVVKSGDSFDVTGAHVRVVPAYNVHRERQNYHPKSAGHVGYVVEISGTTIYHMGDTDQIPEMDDLGPIDVALVPVSGTYVMDAKDAAACVKDLKPRIAIPMHYGDVVGSEADAEEFRSLVGDICRIEILKPAK